MKRYIRSSADPATIADPTKITKGRYTAALNIDWNVSDDDADRLINGRCEEFSHCGVLPLKDGFASVDYDTEGVAESRGYLRGFVVTDYDGNRYYYGVAPDRNQNIEYIKWMRRAKA